MSINGIPGAYNSYGAYRATNRSAPKVSVSEEAYLSQSPPRLAALCLTSISSGSRIRPALTPRRAATWTGTTASSVPALQP